MEQKSLKSSQRLLGRAWFDTIGAATVNDPGLLPAVRRLGMFASALDTLKDAGLFAPDLEPEDVRDRHVGRVLTLGLFLRHVEGEDTLEAAGRHGEHRVARDAVAGDADA